MTTPFRLVLKDGATYEATAVTIGLSDLGDKIPMPGETFVQTRKVSSGPNEHYVYRVWGACVGEDSPGGTNVIIAERVTEADEITKALYATARPVQSAQ
jgi:hypothetical protein